MIFITPILYIISAILFVFGIKQLSKATTARRGNATSALGMLIAIIATLVGHGFQFQWIIVGALAGAIIGVLASKLVKMTAMPEMVALFNGFGGLASLLVGWGTYQVVADAMGVGWGVPALDAASAAKFMDDIGGGFSAATIYLAILIGGITFTGSIIAWGKLSGVVTQKPVLFTGQNVVNFLIVLAILVGAVWFTVDPEQYWIAVVATGVALVLGIMVVIPIGGADMPVVISLLNSYSGLAASAAGFILGNNVLIVAGSLVGASGLILTQIMCKSMNRSLANVLFSGFGSVIQSSSSQVEGEVKALSGEDAYYILEAASNVLFVPGYGMAVAQAQHAVRELADLLEENGIEIRYAIHPVAGRMPGHMNVLLAEANVPYEQLVEPEDVNPTMDTVDVAVVIGANDVVNPAAREDQGSPLYGMPIINVDGARTVFVLKRSMNPGFSGVQNPLFFKDNTRMLFGDAKTMLSELISEFKEAMAG